VKRNVGIKYIVTSNMAEITPPTYMKLNRVSQSYESELLIPVI